MELLKKLLSETKWEKINTEPFAIKRYSLEPTTNKEKKKLITAYKIYNEELKKIINDNLKSIARLESEMT